MVRLSKEMNNNELLPYDSFFSILRNSNLLEKDYNDFQIPFNSGLKTEQAVAKLRMDIIPQTGVEKSSYLGEKRHAEFLRVPQVV